MSNYQSFCEKITAQIFSLIDQHGSLLSWQQDWKNNFSNSLPVGSAGLYHGANLFMLLCVQYKGGFCHNKWLTFNQVKKQGGSVKKGAKSEAVFFWQFEDKQEQQDDNETNNTSKEIKHAPLIKWYRVFNLEQTTLDPAEHAITHHETGDGIERIKTLISRLGISISHFGSNAYYSADHDTIILPNPSTFNSVENYCITLLHELVHATAGKGRIERECFNKYKKDKQARAQEELIAEIGSVFLAAHYGLKGSLENHASYVQSWKKDLNEKQVMSAANKAAKIFEWLIEK